MFLRISEIIICLSTDGFLLQKWMEFEVTDLLNVDIDCELEIKNVKSFEITKEEVGNHVVWEYDNENNLKISVYDEVRNCISGWLLLNNERSKASINILESEIILREYTFDVLFFCLFQILLIYKSGIVLHAAAIEYGNKGILFTAPSQTGKTTQANLWIKYYRATMINGDRPAITYNNDFFCVHGTPWSGSDPVYRNISLPIQAIVILTQATTNHIRLLEHTEAIRLILPRVIMPFFDEYLTDMALKCLEKLLTKVPIYKLSCRPDQDSVELLKNQLSLLKE